MDLHKVKITQTGLKSVVYIDGVQVKGLRAVAFNSDMDSAPTVKIEFITVDADIEINEAEVDQEPQERARTL